VRTSFNRPRQGKTRRLNMAIAAVLAGAFVPQVLSQAPAAASGALVGTFTVTAGSCSGGSVSGSYFRMILQGGNANGPYLSNSDSSCSDQSYTPMSPGTDGGLQTGVYQPQPSPPFDSNGNSLAGRIIAPANFYGVRYGASTQSVDPQTGLTVPPPQITANGSSLSGSLQAVSVSWNNQYFNQGSPKPDGTDPGNTTPVAGTYDPSTGDYTLQWTSQVVGGPFNGFSGLWHLTGRFVASSSAGVSGATGGGTSGRGSSTAAGTTAGPATSSSSPPTAGASSSPAAGTQASAGTNRTPSTGGTVLATRTVRRSGLSVPTWLVALVIAAGVAALGAFIATDRRIRSLTTAHGPGTAGGVAGGQGSGEP
jgi:hypothetical protein